MQELSWYICQESSPQHLWILLIQVFPVPLSCPDDKQRHNAVHFCRIATKTSAITTIPRSPRSPLGPFKPYWNKSSVFFLRVSLHRNTGQKSEERRCLSGIKPRIYNWNIYQCTNHWATISINYCNSHHISQLYAAHRSILTLAPFLPLCPSDPGGPGTPRAPCLPSWPWWPRKPCSPCH